MLVDLACIMPGSTMREVIGWARPRKTPRDRRQISNESPPARCRRQGYERSKVRSVTAISYAYRNVYYMCLFQSTEILWLFEGMSAVPPGRSPGLSAWLIWLLCAKESDSAKRKELTVRCLDNPKMLVSP
jgi:hypothetical protein